MRHNIKENIWEGVGEGGRYDGLYVAVGRRAYVARGRSVVTRGENGWYVRDKVLFELSNKI